jgi:hypothetical protein
MLYSVLRALGGIYLLVALWYGVQLWIRRHSPNLPPDCDPLERYFGACHRCAMGDSCGAKPDPDPEDPAPPN